MDGRRRSQRRNPPRKRKRQTTGASVQHKQQNEPKTTCITDLDDASLSVILEFLPGSFRFIAGVNRRFRLLCRHPPDTLYTAAMTSGATRAIWLEEDEVNVRDNGCLFAAKYGNLEALQWFKSHGCRWNFLVCKEAAAGGHLHILRWTQSQTPPCPWDAQLCLYFSRRGSEVERFIRSHL